MKTATILSYKTNPADTAEEDMRDIWQQSVQQYLSTANQNGQGLYDHVIQQIERPLIEFALRQCRGNQIRAAKMLGINRNTLHKKIRILQIPVKKRNHDVA